MGFRSCVVYHRHAVRQRLSVVEPNGPHPDVVWDRLAVTPFVVVVVDGHPSLLSATLLQFNDLHKGKFIFNLNEVGG
jgi:hypothetical protein